MPGRALFVMFGSFFWVDSVLVLLPSTTMNLHGLPGTDHAKLQSSYQKDHSVLDTARAREGWVMASQAC